MVQPTGGEVEVDDQWLLNDPANPQWHHAATNNVQPGTGCSASVGYALKWRCDVGPCHANSTVAPWPRHVTNSTNVPGRNHLRNCSAKQFDPCYPPQETALATFETFIWQQRSELSNSIQETADLRVQLQEEEVSIQCSLQSAQPANLPSRSFWLKRNAISKLVKNTGLFQLAQNLSLVPFPTVTAKKRRWHTQLGLKSEDTSLHPGCEFKTLQLSLWKPHQSRSTNHQRFQNNNSAPETNWSFDVGPARKWAARSRTKSTTWTELLEISGETDPKCSSC